MKSLFSKTLQLSLMLSLMGCGAAAVSPFLNGVTSLGGIDGFSTETKAVPRGKPVEIRRYTVKADGDANERRAIMVDIVYALDEKLFVSLMTLKAREYFKQAQQFKRDYPGSMIIERIEVVPGSSFVDQPLPDLDLDDVIGAVVFARYSSDQPHRSRVGTGDHLHIHLKRHTFDITSDSNN